MKPIELPPNQQHHFYAGGPRIARFRGVESADDQAPEDWVGSVTPMFGQSERGLSRLDDGRLLSEALAADPEAFLSPDHLARYGADPALLVKLLDAGQRLPVHVHPTREFARRHLSCPYGKSEAWVVLEAREGAEVHLGFRSDVAEDQLAGWVRRQDTAAVLGALHALPVSEGDAVFVPAGMPHAIGEGILVVELQEPTDFSVLLEWDGFGLDGTTDGHLGLGFDVALGCVDRSGWAVEALEELRAERADNEDGGVRRLLPPVADTFFRAERIRPQGGAARADEGLAILVVVDGDGVLRSRGGDLVLRRGQTVLAPHAAGELLLEGSVDIVVCRPPAPEIAAP